MSDRNISKAVQWPRQGSRKKALCIRRIQGTQLVIPHRRSWRRPPPDPRRFAWMYPPLQDGSGRNKGRHPGVRCARRGPCIPNRFDAGGCRAVPLPARVERLAERFRRAHGLEKCVKHLTVVRGFEIPPSSATNRFYGWLAVCIFAERLVHDPVRPPEGKQR